VLQERVSGGTTWKNQRNALVHGAFSVMGQRAELGSRST